jgi:hypothetical protein
LSIETKGRRVGFIYRFLIAEFRTNEVKFFGRRRENGCRMGHVMTSKQLESDAGLSYAEYNTE